MMKTANDNSAVSIVVAERGANWSLWVEQFQTSGSVVLVVQRADETIHQLAQRVGERVRDLKAPIAEAVIVGGGRVDDGVMTARSLAIRSLVAPMVEQRSGRLSLDGSGRDRFSMMALASTVASQVRGTGVRVAPTSRALPHVA